MESLMLTADKNVINVAWIVQYRVSEPQAYLFHIKNVRQAVRDISESVTRRIVGIWILTTFFLIVICLQQT